MIIRNAIDSDYDTLAAFETEIARISFNEDAIIDEAFHKRRIMSAADKSGMFVIESIEKDILGWMWMEKRENSVTKERYINFRSFYIDKTIRGQAIVNELMQKGIAYAHKLKCARIVGKVHVDNLPMRIIYKANGFQPVHISMEMKLNSD